MNLILVTITIFSLSICGTSKNIIKEDLEVPKKQSSNAENLIVYKKVPTKWIKTDKKSN